MSLDFSQKYDAPIVTTSLTPQDDGEVSLRPKLLSEEIEAVKKYLAHEYQIYTEVTSTRAGKN